MTVLEILVPLFIVVLLSLPLVKVFTGKASVKQAKTRLALHISGFAGAVLLTLALAMSGSSVFAASGVASITGTIAQGLGFLSCIFINWFLCIRRRYCRSSCCSCCNWSIL